MGLILTVLLSLNLMTDTEVRFIGIDVPEKVLKDCKQLDVKGVQVKKDETTGDFLIIVALECQVLSGVDN